MEPGSTAKRAYSMRWWTLIVIAVSVLIVVIDASIVNIALPTLQRELNATGTELQWIINAYIMVFASLMLTTGTLGDRLGRKRILQVGILLFAAASLAAAFSASALQLIAWRAVMGIGGAMILPATLAIITNVFPVEERGKAIGVWAGLNGIGIALGPIIGGAIIDKAGWNWIFLINLPIAAIALTAGWFLIPESRDPRPKRADWPGTVLSALALANLVFGLIKGSDWGWTHPIVVMTLCWSIVLITMFVRWERYTKHPMMELGFFRNPRFSAGVGAVSITALGQIGITFGLTLYMQFVQGYTALETGIRFVPLAVGIMMGAGSSYKLVKFLGTTRVIGLGFILLTATVIVAALWQVDTAYWQVGAVFFGLGFFLGYIAAPATDAIMSALPEARAGIGSAMNSVSRMVAGALGIAIIGSVLNSVYRSSFDDAASTIPTLPPDVASAARDSVGAAVTIADKLPPALGEPLAAVARESFMDAWQVMAIVSGYIAITGAFFVFKYMPARRAPGD